MLSSVSIVSEMRPRNKYICSDGSSHYNSFEATKKEYLLRIEEILGQFIVRDGRIRKCKRFYFTRHIALEEGVYHIVLRNLDDLEALDQFLLGLDEKLGYPEEDKFPMEIDIDFYYDDIPGVVNERCDWKIYDPNDYRRKN